MLPNLLPESRVRALSKDYLLRLATVAAVAVAALVVVHGALLIPSYIYLSEEVQTRREHLENINLLTSSSEERAIGERSTKLEENAKALLALARLPDALPVVEALLNLPHQGVRVTGLAVTPSLEGGEAKLSVTGVASTRESLRRYHQALSALSFVTKADLPLSVYASESEIPFTVALTATLP